MDVLLSYVVVLGISSVAGIQTVQKRDLFQLCLLLNMSDEGFKMIETKDPQFNTFNKGVNLMNTMFTFIIGFATEKNSTDFKDQVSLGLDIRTSFLVLACSTLFALLIGAFMSLLLSKVAAIRQTAVSEIMFMIFGTYLLSSIAFLDHKWDFVSEELSVLIFGVFCSHFTRYNLSFQSASRLR